MPDMSSVAGQGSTMPWLQATYTIRHNVRHRLRGYLFQGRSKAIIVDFHAETCSRTVRDHIPLNRASAALLEPRKKLGDFSWSSFFAMIGAPRECPGGLEVERFVKIALVAFFKSRTVVTNLWIARRL